MDADTPSTGLQLRSLVRDNATVELSLVAVEVPAPRSSEVVIRIDATPINPSDLGLLLAGADLATATVSGSPDAPVVTASIPMAAMRGSAGRVGQSLAVGNEGAGVVVAAGDSEGAQALLGKTVAAAGGAMYSQYRCIDAAMCLELPAGTSAAEGASCFVNPLTALGMVETMRREGHLALVHTAAASNLGQMLNRLCIQDGIPLVNIVRRPEQEEILRSAGATHVCNSGSPDFMADLIAVLMETKATIAFDAVGGGRLAGQILTGMEAAATSATVAAGTYNRYGSATHKQVYIYGGLDRGPTELARNFGMAWSIGGWLLTPFLEKIGFDALVTLRRRVADEIMTTFASTYTDEVSLAGALDPAVMAVYALQSTGAKYLISPQA